MQNGETSVFLCEPETFWLFRLRDRDFKVFWVRARDVWTIKIRAPDLVQSYEKIWQWARISLYKSLTKETFVVNLSTVNKLLFSWPWPNFRSGGYTWSFAFDFFVTDALSLTFVCEETELLSESSGIKRSKKRKWWMDCTLTVDISL